MMNKEKILININNLTDIEDYKKIGITNFLFAVKNLSIGYNEFELDEIPTNSYLLINRVFDTKGIALVKELKSKLLTFKGIIFEDLGIYNLFKDEDIELIWFQNHFVTNIKSLNYYLDHNCTSAVLSNEITKEELTTLINEAHKPIILNVLGKNQIMYSRRTLVNNFNNQMNLDNRNIAFLNEQHTKQFFEAKESQYGTIIFNNNYFNYIDFAKSQNVEKIKFYLVMNLDLDIKEINNILNGKKFGNDGFLNKKTVYKMSEYTDR